MSTPESSADYPAPAFGWYAIFILYLGYTLAFVDRQIMAFLVGPIRADFGITDFQFSLIQGFAFALFYALLGIPIARLADSRNRRNIVSIGVALWSAMTALCGMAGNYIQLFLFRLGVGVGEASLSPSAISMISDYFPREKRSLPISVYSAGVHGGAGLSYIFGGLVVGFSMTGGVQVLPLIGEVRPWQIAFLLVGLPGLLVALLMLTVREPERRERMSSAAAGIPFGQTIAYMRRHFQIYATLIVAAALAAMSSYSTFSWVPALYERRFGWTPPDIGVPFGLITIVFGTAGLVAGGMTATHMVKRGIAAPYNKLMIGCMALSAPPAFLLVAVNDPYWTLICLTLLVIFLSAPIGLVQTALQAITPNDMRAQVIAIYLLLVALIGQGIGPSAVAAMTDYYYADDALVGSSIAVVVGIACVISTVLYWIGIGAYERKVNSPD